MGCDGSHLVMYMSGFFAESLEKNIINQLSHWILQEQITATLTELFKFSGIISPTEG